MVTSVPASSKGLYVGSRNAVVGGHSLNARRGRNRRKIAVAKHVKDPPFELITSSCYPLAYSRMAFPVLSNFVSAFIPMSRSFGQHN